MKFLYKIIFDIILVVVIPCNTIKAQTNQKPETIPYNWENVQIVGWRFAARNPACPPAASGGFPPANPPRCRRGCR